MSKPSSLEAENAKLRRRLQERSAELGEMRDYVHHLERLMSAAERRAGRRLFPRGPEEVAEENGFRARGGE